MASLALEALDYLEANTPFSLEPILVDLEEGIHVGLILPVTLEDLLAGWRPSVGGGG